MDETVSVKPPSTPASCVAQEAMYGSPPLRGGSWMVRLRFSLVEALVLSIMPLNSFMRLSTASAFITHRPARTCAAESWRTISTVYDAPSRLG